jgi:enamine deaminase RidA (YjgF/YER057c/UK114 family)
VLATGNKILLLSGQIGDDENGKPVSADAGEQARRCLQNIDALLGAGGATRSDVTRIVVFLTDMNDRADVAQARRDYFGDHKPAATLVAVSALVAPEFKVEIEATAVF